MAALTAPILLIAGLALAGGGFDVTDRHIAGLATWLLIVALIVFGAGSSARLERPLYVAGGLIFGLSVLCATSSLWSGSTELSVIEADRVLAYLGFFIAAYLIAQTDERRQRFAEGLAISIAIVALLGLGSRLLPHVLDVGGTLGSGARMVYPLGYWNANGAMFGIGVALLLWMSRHAAWNALRMVSAALIPALLLALYFTYSRGGLLSLAIGAGVVVALSRDRLWLLATLAIGALGAVPAMLAVQARGSLADNTVAGQAAVDQGATVFFILLAGTAVTLLLFQLLRATERREGRLTGIALSASRNPVVLRRAALVGAVLAIAVAVGVGGRAWDKFSSTNLRFPTSPSGHFTEFSSAGRNDFWRVALDAFDEKPVLGQGAGTYELSWTKHRSIHRSVRDAHSLYLEAFAELGLVGGLLVLALVGVLLWTAFAAWREAAHPDRDRYAALLAAMLAFAVGAAFDWFWEIAALGGIFFLAGGVAVAARCAQIAADPRREPQQPRGNRGTALAVVALGLAWIAAVALVGPLLVERELDSSHSAAAADNIPSAVDHAETARSIEPWAASPYVQLSLLAELQGDYATARKRAGQAIDREDGNWQWYYLRARIEHEAGEAAAARADLERALRLNPLETCLRREDWSCP